MPMNYDQYIKYQVEGPGMIKKPLHYRIGERRAIDWFFSDVPKIVKILDIGCGSGAGMTHLRSKGYKNVVGLDLNEKKVWMCRRRGLPAFLGDIAQFDFLEKFDVIWSSHSFEHVRFPQAAVDNLIRHTEDKAKLFFVMPYPDLTPAIPHCASSELGLDIDDGGRYVTTWFTSRGLNLIEKKMDSYREPEIWLKMER